MVLSLRNICGDLRRTLKIASTSKAYPEPHVSIRTQPAASCTSRTRTETSPDGRDKTDDPLSLGYHTVLRLRSDPDATCKEGLGEWNDWYAEHVDREVRDWKASEMVHLGYIMSKVFFLDKLEHPIHFEWKTDLALPGGNTVFGHASHSHIYGLIIRMDPTDHSVTKGLDTHKTAILSTFLHELTHSYLQSFCCDGTDLHVERLCSKDGHIIWRKRGCKSNAHDFGWFLIACEISLRMESWLGVAGHTFALRALLTYCDDGGIVSAGNWSLFLWKFTVPEVLRLFDHLQHGKGERRKFRERLRMDPAVMKVWVVWSEKYLEQ